jgi:sugar phosphate isomerase/epimerase
MIRSSIGVDVDDFRLPLKDALRKAAELSFRAVELATVSGDVAPSNLSSTGRRQLSRYVDGLGLRMAALVADLPGLRLTDTRTIDERVERTCQVLDLAADLKVPVVASAVGALTHPETGEPSDIVLAALARIGERADARSVLYALRPSYDSSDRLTKVLEALGCPAIGVCLDPAAMVMVGANPLSVIERLPQQIALVYARDGTAGFAERLGYESRLGEGEVDLVGMLAALSAADYRGSYIIRRTDSGTPLADIEDARDTLLNLLPPGCLKL